MVDHRAMITIHFEVCRHRADRESAVPPESLGRDTTGWTETRLTRGPYADTTNCLLFRGRPPQKITRKDNDSGVTVGLLRGSFLISVSLWTTPFLALGEHRMINVGDRRLYLDCSGQVGPPTVVLLAGAGSTTGVWGKVQPPVARFTRVCSYDRAGDGYSDKAPSSQQSVDEVVYDLRTLLNESGEKSPFILVAHSRAGLYARRFVTRFPNVVSGLVFVDSSHEESRLRQHELDPKLQLDDNDAHIGFFIKPGERLTWRTDVPLIVLARGKTFPRTPQMTEEQWAVWDRTWRELQEDLARRSIRGEFRLAGQSGHFIQLDQPELVIEAILDVSHNR